MDVALLDSVPLEFGGGYETFVMDVAAWGQAHGHQVHVVTPTASVSSITNRVLRLPVTRRLGPCETRRRLGGAAVMELGLRQTRAELHRADVAYVKNEPHEVAYTIATTSARRPVIVGFHSAM